MDLLLVIIIIIIFLFFKERLKNNSNAKYIKDVTFEKRNYEPIKLKETNPYKKKQYLLTSAEKSFFNLLQFILKDSDYYICPKVRLADIVYVHEKYNFTAYFNKIKSKHIDFLLCDKTTMSPLIAIELDDSSHLDVDRIERDTFVNLTLKESGINIIRFNVSRSYDVNDIKDKLNINKTSS